MASATRIRSSNDHPAEEDLGWALGALLRSYREFILPAVCDFPHGARGYETVRQVLKGGQPNQLWLANHLGIDRTVMTYLLDDLVEAGLIERRPNPDDRRQRLIVATPQGKQAVEHLCEEVTSVERRLLAELTDKEQVLFRSLLTKVACASNVSQKSACHEVAPSA
jgi:MarR family transcriptional regulator for hemolysin